MTTKALQVLPVALPALLAFFASNFVNAGNLAYNMIFSRLMGPALFGDLAVVLTIKLAILAVLGAGQMAVGQMVASATPEERSTIETSIARLSWVSFGVLWLVLPAVLFVLWQADVAQALGLQGFWVLGAIMLSLPVTAPMAFVRGVILGRVAMARFAWSVNLEMAVRLVASIAAWFAGLGIEGVAAAFAVSIFAGWWAIAGDMPSRPAKGMALPQGFVKTLALMSLPFAALQGAQVALLDGDILVAKVWLSADEAGLAGLLGLVQRIQFYACFGLSAVLLPTVARAVAEGRNPKAEVMPVATIFMAVSAALIAGAAIAPQLVIQALAGKAFLGAAGLLLPVVLAAAFFTLSYLLATMLVALGDKGGIALILAMVPAQAGAMWLMAQGYLPALLGQGLAGLVAVKLVAQVVLATALCAYTLRRVSMARKAARLALLQNGAVPAV